MGRATPSLRVDLIAVAGAATLSLATAGFLNWLATAPDDYQGRMIVRFDDKPPTMEALQRIVGSGATPIRAMPFINAWVVRADTGSVAELRHNGAWLMLRDLGFDAIFAGCLGAATGPARAPIAATPR
ncbi:MAG: hypothetical protein P1U65_15280 [Minwuia sp.]|nr:hypothetical protein [Minwuia sp.]